MPQQSSPPYLPSAKVYPRYLDKWDDINSQNGRLERTKTFITIPAFNIAVNWQGYSDIVGAFNYESPNNFSFNPFTAPLNPSYALCVSYRVGNILTRYLMWDAIGSLLHQEVPLYKGQILKKNFRFEIWSTNQGDAVQMADLTFITSVLGGKDYRYDVDSKLVGDDGEVDNFGNNGISVALWIVQTNPSCNVLLGSSPWYGAWPMGSTRGLILNGKPTYTSPDNSVYVAWDDPQGTLYWYIRDDYTEYFYSQDDVVDPSLITTWIPISGIGDLPLFTNGNYYNIGVFNLPLIFPSNSVSQSN